MEIALLTSTLFAAVFWVTVIAAPIRPTGTRERLASNEQNGSGAEKVTVLIPARNEERTISRTLDSLARQEDVAVIVVDDQSTDQTARVVSAQVPKVQIIHGTAPPPGWIGKVWALEQGFRKVHTPLVLLLDADIELAPGMVCAMQKKLAAGELDLVSVMARLRTDSLWERLLIPAYVYFFKLLYPFALVNSERTALAAAAGGCMLVRKEALDRIGGFAALKSAIIDDCALARLIKRPGHPIWLGLTDCAFSNRGYERLTGLWNLVARSAFAELKFSLPRLLICSTAMLALFVVPIAGLAELPAPPGYFSLIAVLAMLASYLPLLRFYSQHPLRAFTLPFVAIGYLAMTWHSALRYWLGTRTIWKNRRYPSIDFVD